MAQSTASETLKVNGVDRTYLLHLPSGYRAGKPLPVLLVLHGMGMTAELMADVTGLNRWADKTSLIAGYPQGLEQRWHTGAIDSIPPTCGAARTPAAIATIATSSTRAN